MVRPGPEYAGTPQTLIALEAWRSVGTMLLENLKADLKRYGPKQQSLASKINLIRNSPGFCATVVYRFGRWIDSVLVSPAVFPIKCLLIVIYFCLNWVVVRMWGIHLDRKAIIGKGLKIPHFGGIVVRRCQIGDNCTIFQHVRIGGTARNSSPRIGREVWFGPHARCEVSVTVGDNVTISAGSVVTQDVKEGCLIGGDPARVIDPKRMRGQKSAG